MKKCSVCETEIRSDLEEFGDSREPVCARCWLEGNIPGLLPEDRIRKLREQIRSNENYLHERYRELSYCEEEDYENLDIEKIQSSMIVVEVGVPLPQLV